MQDRLSVLPVILGASPFDNFMRLSHALYQREGATWQISQRRLFALLFNILTTEMGVAGDEVSARLGMDYESSGEKGRFENLVTAQEKTDKTGLASKRQTKQI